MERTEKRETEERGKRGKQRDGRVRGSVTKNIFLGRAERESDAGRFLAHRKREEEKPNDGKKRADDMGGIQGI